MIPKIGETDGIPFDQKIVHETYSLLGKYWWVVVEREGDEAFGWANLNDDQNAEWGYLSISELKRNGANQVYHNIGKPFKEVKEGIDQCRARLERMELARTPKRITIKYEEGDSESWM